MIGHWYRDWRERRSVLRELGAERRAEEAILANQTPNFIQLAKFALDTGDLATAAARWEEARTRLPNHIYASRDSVGILCGLGRHGEAEALVREGTKRSRSDRYWPASFAEIAESQGHLEEAVTRWRRLSNGSGLEPDGDLRAAVCLRLLGRLDEAWTLAGKAARRNPEHIGPCLEFARIADLRQDWNEALTRWTFLLDRFRHVPAILRRAHALIELGRGEEAEAFLLGKRPDHPDNQEIIALLADLASRHANLGKGS